MLISFRTGGISRSFRGAHDLWAASPSDTWVSPQTQVLCRLRHGLALVAHLPSIVLSFPLALMRLPEQLTVLGWLLFAGWLPEPSSLKLPPGKQEGKGHGRQKRDNIISFALLHSLISLCPCLSVCPLPPPNSVSHPVFLYLCVYLCHSICLSVFSCLSFSVSFCVFFYLCLFLDLVLFPASLPMFLFIYL